MTLPGYPPEICALVEELAATLEGRPCPDQGQAAVAAARELNLRTRLRAVLTSAMAAGPGLDPLWRWLDSLLKGRESVVDQISVQLSSTQPALVALAHDLQDLSWRIVTAEAQLESGRRSLAQDAAFDALDDVIKIARSVLLGLRPREVLALSLPQLAGLQQTLFDEGQAFLSCHPDQEQVGGLLSQGLQAYQAGAQALGECLWGPLQEEKLCHGLALLIEAGAHLSGAQQTMEQVREQPGCSRIPVLDTLAALTRSASPQAVAEHLPQLQAWLQGVREHCLQFREINYPHAQQVEHWEKLVQPALEAFHGALSGPLHASLVSLGDDLAQKVWTWMNATPLPRPLGPWQELFESARGWYLRGVPGPFLVARSEQLCLACVALEARVADMPPLEQEGLGAALRGPREILEELAQVTRRGDRAALPELLQRLEDCYDRWLWVQDTLTRWQPPDPLIQARGRARVFADLRPLLARTLEVAREASQRLSAWERARGALLQTEARLAQHKADLTTLFGDLEQSLADLLQSADDGSPAEQHGPSLDHLGQVLADLGRAQTALAQLASAAPEPEGVQASVP